jgi:hypothetical protein
MTICWYSLDTALRTVEHGSLALDEAYDLIDRFFGQLRPHYDSGEEALAASMFGFTRPDGSYMQICVHAPDMIEVEYDFSLVKNRLLRLVAGRRQRWERLRSRDQLRTRTSLFFTLSREAFQIRLRGGRGDERSEAGA